VVRDGGTVPVRRHLDTLVGPAEAGHPPRLHRIVPRAARGRGLLIPTA
jgi:hypothetical protein